MGGLTVAVTGPTRLLAYVRVVRLRMRDARHADVAIGEGRRPVASNSLLLQDGSAVARLVAQGPYTRRALSACRDACAVCAGSASRAESRALAMRRSSVRFR